jgi:hypothetical protein
MMHNLETVYRKMRLNANVLPAEMLIVLKDIDQRLLKIEGKNSDGVETTTPARSRSSKVSKKKVSAS